MVHMNIRNCEEERHFHPKRELQKAVDLTRKEFDSPPEKKTTGMGSPIWRLTGPKAIHTKDCVGSGRIRENAQTAKDRKPLLSGGRKSNAREQVQSTRRSFRAERSPGGGVRRKKKETGAGHGDGIDEGRCCHGVNRESFQIKRPLAGKDQPDLSNGKGNVKLTRFRDLRKCRTAERLIKK